MARELVHTGRRIRVYVDTTTAPDGTVIRRDAIVHPGAVVVLPVIDAGHVCLLRNRRWVVGETLWEVPAGTLEVGEPVEAAARRELQEETGYTAATWRSLGYLFASPGVMDEKLHLFVAEDLTPGPTAREWPISTCRHLTRVGMPPAEMPPISATSPSSPRRRR